MSEYTRLTLQGSLNRAEVVLPADEPVAALLPDLLDLLDEPTAQSRPTTLVSLLGEPLNVSLSLAEQNVRQGSIIRLVRVDEVPPPPEVADITQLVGESVAVRRDRWRREWAIVANCGVALTVGVLVGVAGLDPAGPGWSVWSVAAVAAGLVVAAILLARRDGTGSPAVGASGAGWVATALGCGLLAAPAWVWAAQSVGPGPWALWFGGIGVVVGVVAALGFGDRGLALGGACASIGVAVWAALAASGVSAHQAAAIVAVAGALGLGLLPGVAMAASGLTGLDDRTIEGAVVPRLQALDAVQATHAGLTWACLALSVLTGAAGFVLTGDADGWGLALAATVAVIVALRTRNLPLAPQRLALFAAAASIGTGLAITGLVLAPQASLATLAGIGAVSVALSAVRFSGNAMARLGRFGNLLELLAVLASVPLVLGLMGVFADLLGAFR